MNAKLNDYILETTTIVHELIEEETTTPVVEDDAVEDKDDSLWDLSSTLSPLHVPEHIIECPTCQCSCPTLSPIPLSQATPYIMENSSTSEKNLLNCQLQGRLK